MSAVSEVGGSTSSASEEPWGSRLFYRHRAPVGVPDAPPMVHIHGFAISGSVLLPTAKILSQRFDTYVPDLPGHGRSAGPATPLDFIGFADSVVRFLDAVGLERASLVGNSMGSAVIAHVGRLYPDRVERLILVSPAGGAANQPLPRALGQMTLDGLREPVTLMPTAARAYAKFGLRNSFRLFDAMVHSPTLNLLQDIQVPMLVVMGSKDPLLPSATEVDKVARIADLSDVMTAVRLHGAAHAINWSHPQELAEIINVYVADPSIRNPSLLPSKAQLIATA